MTPTPKTPKRKSAARKPSTRKKVTKRKPTAKHDAKSKAAKSKSKAKSDAGEISPVKKRKSAGRPPFVPTDDDRKNVQTLAGLGLKHEEIKLLVTNPTTGKPIDVDTLVRHFSSELAKGAPMAAAKIAQSLFRKAIGDGPQSVTAAIWFSKCRMGWKERVAVDVEVKSGVLVAPSGMSPDEWIAAAALRSAGKTEPGAED